MVLAKTTNLTPKTDTEMYLKEIEIFAFKSFPDKTTLKFEPGITVVVGPNGCGKSNVFDAIKWALGEQAPKSLRGTKMEDVIFNGTENHPPLNYTEVALTFQNEDKYLPIDYKEVSIGRRLYRSGESEYFINKNPVRLKDVEELFMGTGIGEATYSFIEQGKIEIFLSYKPEDKRLIFDEASGIVKYKERKKETLKKLEEAEENLLRLEDIISEVRRQTRYLERQVEKAKQYKEVQEKLVEVEKNIASLQYANVEAKINKLLDELNLFKEKEEGKDRELEEINGRWEVLHSQLKALRIKLEQTTTAIVSLGAHSESAQSRIGIDRQRIKELEDRNVNLKISKDNLSQRLELQKKRSQEEIKRAQDIVDSLKALEETNKTLAAEKNNLEELISETKKKISQEKTLILEWEAKKTQAHNNLIELQTKLASLNNRKKRLILDKAKLDTLLSEHKENFARIDNEYVETKNILEALQSKKSILAHKDEELNSLIEKTNRELIDKEKELLELNASYEFLKDLRIKYETFSVKKKITVIFDEEPKDINKLVASLNDVTFRKDTDGYRAEIEAKVVSFQEKQLEEKISAVRIQIEENKKMLNDFQEARKRLSNDLSVENSQIEEQKLKLQQRLQEKESLERESSRLEEEKELLNQETKATLAEIQDGETKQSLINQESALCEDSLNKINENLSKSQETIANSLERIKEIDIEAARNLAQAQSLANEREALVSRISIFEDEIRNTQATLGRIDKESQDNDLSITSLSEEIVSLDAAIGESKNKIQEYSEEKKTQEAEEVSLTAKIDETKGLIQKLEKESQELKASSYNKKLEIQSLEYEKEKIKDYLRQVYNVEFKPKPAGEAQDTADGLLAEKEKLKKKIDSLGEVNLVAIEEFEELKKRESFLENQKQDLVTSKENLKKAIAKINHTSKELFVETFGKIEIEFKNNFKFLFGGGRANLILLDPENVLESGVEIEVQPPGKKLQNVSLLSGGEKALTAIALIFAIFRVRPSPLCVLDEIDAPLDEANVDRFNHILKQFASFSQFILITHNKKTMSNADVLYGVTMQEKGISKLVSVKFAAEKDKNIQEAPASKETPAS